MFGYTPEPNEDQPMEPDGWYLHVEWESFDDDEGES